MKKLIKLSKLILSLGLKEESIKILKIAQALPEGYSIEPEPTVGGGFGTPVGLTSSLLRKNLDLKEIFSKEYNKDPSFFDSFTYIHFPRGDSSSNAEFIRNYGSRSGGSPIELSVIGSPKYSACELKNSTAQHIGGTGSIAFLMEGTPTSAFYYDATSSYYGQMQSPEWIKTLEDAGINPDEYNPKIVNINEGRLGSFFFNRESYEQIAASGHPSNYHEIILKNAKVKKVLVDERIDKEELVNFFDIIDPYWIGKDDDKKIDVIYCSGSAKIEGLAARDLIINHVESFFYTTYDNKKRLDKEIFEKTFIFPPVSSDPRETFTANKSRGLNVLIEGVQSDVDTADIISVANDLIENNEFRQEKINKLMSEYINSYSTTASIDNLKEIWSNAFTSYNDIVDSSFMPESSKPQFLQLSSRMKEPDKQPIEEFIKPLFESIKNKIISNLNSSNKIKDAINDYISLLSFLVDSGAYFYEKNKKNKAFNYFLVMVGAAAKITELISQNKEAKETLVNLEDAGFLRTIYSIKDYEFGTNILTMIINIFKEFNLDTKEEIEESLRKAEEQYIMSKKYREYNRI